MELNLSASQYYRRCERTSGETVTASQLGGHEDGGQMAGCPLLGTEGLWESCERKCHKENAGDNFGPEI